MKKTIVTWLWGDKYGAEHVRKLLRMCSLYVREWDFVCISDRALPGDIPHLVYRPTRSEEKIRCFRRMVMFSREWGDRFGTIINMDLDTLLLKSCADLFPVDDARYDVTIWKAPSIGVHGYAFCPGAMMFRPHVLEPLYWKWSRYPTLTHQRAASQGWTGSDQAMIGHHIAAKTDLTAPMSSRKRGSVFTFGELQQVYSYRDHVIKDKKDVRDAVMIGFYGPYDPMTIDAGWIKDAYASV